MVERRVVVLVVASGAAWEATALGRLNEHPRVVVLKRCVDVDDLLAAASTGRADVAVLGLDAPGLDLAAAERLARHGVRPVAIVPGGPDAAAARLRAARIGIRTLVEVDDLASLGEAVIAPEPTPGPVVAPDPGPDRVPGRAPTHAGRVIVVWGPAGAPGRTTVASGLAAGLAARGRDTLLIDADPYGGCVAQQLGILDEVSGLLAATRLAASGQLPAHFASVQRGLQPHFSVITGLPRADRWAEIRPGALEHLLEVARTHGDVVVDTGFSLEDGPGPDFGSRPARNHLTLEALHVADEVIVVGNPDPVGLARLARSLVELRELTDGAPVRVVVNRMRPTLGWTEQQIAELVAGFSRLSGVHFLPDDRAGVDRALVAGQTLLEIGETSLARALEGLVDVFVPGPAQPGSHSRSARIRRRTAGTTRRR